jgi:hypothetical protein
MIKTGDWTVADLIKYLVNVQSTLSATEIERLQATSAFVKEGGEQTARFRAVDLYEPQDNIRQLGLPILDWGANTKWKASSEEGKFIRRFGRLVADMVLLAKFLYKLGLRRFPPLKTIISLCASNEINIRAFALKYFLNNYTSRYSDFDPNNFTDLAFIPALDQTTPCMAMHREVIVAVLLVSEMLTYTWQVFSSLEWSSLGFFVAHPSLNVDALGKLKIKDRPEPFALVNLLEKTPPKDEATARQWFGALAGHIAGIQWYILSLDSRTS